MKPHHSPDACSPTALIEADHAQVHSKTRMPAHNAEPAHWRALSATLAVAA
jgi:hypothetical protein